MLVKAKRPVILAEFVGRDPEGFRQLVKLAETVAAPVYSLNTRLNFPSCHPLNMSMVDDIFSDADLILGLDVRGWERATTKVVSTTRKITNIVPATCLNRNRLTFQLYCRLRIKTLHFVFSNVLKIKKRLFRFFESNSR
jgi:thiamine pyrophosphate-dependent acetolactate synthase large subunit-like protein